MKVKEIEKMLKQAGWAKDEGSKHTKWIKEGERPITVPRHKGDVPIGTANSILKAAGLK
ncbi:MAG: type II toxin-antitoxin system HicA family toxin [bacterium]|nr:type II toxin-antitoxin system HicA family toxin [bacterium]